MSDIYSLGLMLQERFSSHVEVPGRDPIRSYSGGIHVTGIRLSGCVPPGGVIRRHRAGQLI